MIKVIRSSRGGRDFVFWSRTEIMEDSMKKATLRPPLSDGWDLKKWDWRRELEVMSMKRSIQQKISGMYSGKM